MFDGSKWKLTVFSVLSLSALSSEEFSLAKVRESTFRTVQQCCMELAILILLLSLRARCGGHLSSVRAGG